MCEWCKQETPVHCQVCGMQICQDEIGNDFAPYVTSYGDLYCWNCGRSEQAEIDMQEMAEAEEWGWMEFDPYSAPPEWDNEEYEDEP